MTVATAGDPTRLARSTASMTVLTAVSRLTGFIRILVVAAVLGTTFLGNVYESANTVPNLLFELIAAGVLQAVLIPTLVAQLDRGDRAEAEHVAGSVLIPLNELAARVAEIPDDRDVYVMCRVGGRSARAVDFLRASGRPRSINVSGGIDAWVADLLPVEETA